jgi:2-oxoglutarate ferredoxin oxidoreductase subunit beta
VEAHTPKDYRSGLKPVWCPGCGDFGVLNAVYRALSILQLAPEEVAIVSGIGCSSRLPGYVATYGFNGIHGRALPLAQGVKFARPETTVIAVGGDGDGLSIGGGHLPHVARRNPDITYIMMDNGIYGMTKGQVSPTTGLDFSTKTTPYGIIDSPVNPLKLALSYGVTFYARGFSGNGKQVVDLIVEAIRHKGFAFVQLLSPCVTFVGRNQFDLIRSLAVDLEPDYDPTSVEAAWRIAEEQGRISMGVIYRREESTYEERLEEIRLRAKEKGAGGWTAVVDPYRPIMNRAEAA